MEKKEPKIFIVSGKARHGKSTVADIIKNYYTNKGLKVIDIAYAKYIKDYAMTISDWDGKEETKPRELLQTLGTDIIRKQINWDFFLNRICEDILVYAFFFDVVIISDARYEDEIEGPKSKFKDVTSIRVINPTLESTLTDKEQKHLSETGLDHYNNYDYIIINNEDKKQLENKVLEIVKEI
jgi:hypothetical protein